MPGPRGNLELAQAVAELADAQRVDSLLSTPRQQAPENSAGVFLVFCGVAALGKLAASRKRQYVRRLRAFASDDRWRVREAVAIGLQYIGDANIPFLLEQMQDWIQGNCFEKRAAAAALAEPRLLKDPAAARTVLGLFDEITEQIDSGSLARDESFKVLRQAMGYSWSVAVVALPEAGKPMMEKWLGSASADVRWIMRENLKKDRIQKMDARWATRWKSG